MSGVRFMVDGYQEWLEREAVPVVAGLAVDPTTIETKPWPRLGADVAFIHLDARGDFLNAYVIDIGPGRNTDPQQHLYEAVTYVLDGTGSTVIELPDGQRHSFEWGRGSLFCVPLNARYRLFNGSGRAHARLVNVTDLPITMRLFRNDRFVFDTPFDFRERFGEERYMKGEGTFLPTREHRHMWATNFVPNLLTFNELRSSPARGAGGTSIAFALADGSIHAHVSEIPIGRYKKAHHHDEGYHIFQLSGSGYSLYWRTGGERTRTDWKYGLMHSPENGMWHQHFNVADEPARYLAVQFGSFRYPILESKMAIVGRPTGVAAPFQIEYEDEDPEIKKLFETERQKHLAGKRDAVTSA